MPAIREICTSSSLWSSFAPFQRSATFFNALKKEFRNSKSSFLLKWDRYRLDLGERGRRPRTSDEEGIRKVYTALGRMLQPAKSRMYILNDVAGILSFLSIYGLPAYLSIHLPIQAHIPNNLKWFICQMLRKCLVRIRE